MTAACSLYKHNYPSVIIEQHHVVPKSWFDAAPVDTPMAEICPNCHINTHKAIDLLVAGAVPGKDIPPKCRALAAQAMTLAAAKGLTPARTL